MNDQEYPKHNETFKPQYLYLEYHDEPNDGEDEYFSIEPEEKDRGLAVIELL